VKLPIEAILESGKKLSFFLLKKLLSILVHHWSFWLSIHRRHANISAAQTVAVLAAALMTRMHSTK
jgi:hypothetical protein